MKNPSIVLATTTTAAIIAVAAAVVLIGRYHNEEEKNDNDDNDANTTNTETPLTIPVLPCIRYRHSTFPNAYNKHPTSRIDESVIQSLLDAALWSPFHGKRYKDCQHPAKFVVLGKQAMNEMQQVTLQYYDQHWEHDDRFHGNHDEYTKWRHSTEAEITGRWGPVEYMIRIVVRRQATPSKRFPEWEELAAVATAVQNMHLQACAMSAAAAAAAAASSSLQYDLACYWSSWHSAARDSDEMKEFLQIANDTEDKCLGFFMVAQKDPRKVVSSSFTKKDRRKRHKSLLTVEWRD